MSDVIDNFFQENEAARSLGPKAVLTQLITMSIISVSAALKHIVVPNSIANESSTEYHCHSFQHLTATE